MLMDGENGLLNGHFPQKRLMDGIYNTILWEDSEASRFLMMAAIKRTKTCNPDLSLHRVSLMP